MSSPAVPISYRSGAAAGARMDPAGWLATLAGADGDELTDAERIEAIRTLEELKAAAAAAQARITDAFATSQRAQAPALKDKAAVTRSIGSQVALARKVSPTQGNRHLGLARALVDDLPHTHAALTMGVISEWRATLITRETACLSREDRISADAELAGQLAALGDRRTADLARKIAYRLDPGAAMRRSTKAEADRRVSIRPAPDTMSNLTGLLPVAQGVTAYAALRKHAEALRDAGDPRGIGQIMADTFYHRLTGQETATGPDVEVGLVMSERTLAAGSPEPGLLTSPSMVPVPIPARLARALVRKAHKAWVRRLYSRPESGELVAMESRRRSFTGGLRDLVVWRDQTCRTPWCDAPIRHLDHLRPVRADGKTTTVNGQGLCEACNYVKEAPDWRADVIDAGRHRIQITTPTGHSYCSDAPAQPGAPPRGESLEQRLRRIIDDAA